MRYKNINIKQASTEYDKIDFSVTGGRLVHRWSALGDALDTVKGTGSISKLMEAEKLFHSTVASELGRLGIVELVFIK